MHAQSVVSNSLWPRGLSSTSLLCPWDYPGKNTGVGYHFLPQGIFPTQGPCPHLLQLLHGQADSLPLSHLGSKQLYFNSVQFSHSVVSDSLRPREPQHARPPHSSPTPRVYSNSCALSQWCNPTISSSIVPFSSHLQSFPASGSFQMSQLKKKNKKAPKK